MLFRSLGALHAGDQLLGPPIRIEIGAALAPGQVLFELDYPLLVQRELEEIGRRLTTSRQVRPSPAVSRMFMVLQHWTQ